MISVLLFINSITAQKILGKLKATGKYEPISITSNYAYNGPFYKICNPKDYSEFILIADSTDTSSKNTFGFNGSQVNSIKILPPFQPNYSFKYTMDYGFYNGHPEENRSWDLKIHIFNNFDKNLVSIDSIIRLPKCQDSIVLNPNYNQNMSVHFFWTISRTNPKLPFNPNPITQPIEYFSGNLISPVNSKIATINQIHDTTYVSMSILDSNRIKLGDGCGFSFNSIIIPSSIINSQFVDSICMVTAINNKFKLVWPNTNKKIAQYKIYKQNKVNSKYDLVHTQPASKLSEWIDSSSSANTQIERYKLGIVDSCGVYEYISPTNHTTILLSSNLGVNGTVNLSWNPYQGFQYDNFEIWRSADGTTYNKLASVANNTFSYIDNAPPVTGFYQIRITNPNGCNPDKRGSSYVNSNIVDKTGKSVAKLENNELSSTTIYPNPTTNVINVSAISLGSLITVTDMNGKIIYVHKAEHNNIEIPLANYAQQGIYTLTIQNIDKETIFKKIVLE